LDLLEQFPDAGTLHYLKYLQYTVDAYLNKGFLQRVSPLEFKSNIFLPVVVQVGAAKQEIHILYYL